MTKLLMVKKIHSSKILGVWLLFSRKPKQNFDYSVRNFDCSVQK